VTSFVFSADRCAHVPQYAFEDFAIRQIAQVLGKTDDEALFANRSLVCDLGVAMFTVD
jgi:putative alpha-1,2-mannosidase